MSSDFSESSLSPFQSDPGLDASGDSGQPPPDKKNVKKTLVLALGALGVVYGDIGTSPLYAVKECFHGVHAIALTQNNLFGVMSLIFWSLTMVVMIKYVIFILKADNEG
jgi:KUP system potassium uptake protein